MHCERCHVDFPEELRYCKWCGQALVDRPRVTSELHSCPSCSAAIQPGWTFCKACGERLQRATVTPPAEDSTHRHADKVTPDSADTSVTASCSECGESVDTGSLYCKGCGSAVYTEQTPFGGSALLCGECKSYSPLGSRACRVCGVPFQAARTVVDFPSGLTTVQQKAPTLPDLDEQIAKQSPPAEPGEDAVPGSGANTLVFTGTEQKGSVPLPKGAVETSMLPGTAGSKSEQQSPTQVMHMGRTTGPVETDDANKAPKPSGELTNPSAPEHEAEPPAIKEQSVTPGERTVEFSAVTQSSTKPAGPTTLGLGSDSESEEAPAGSENKTAVFVSRPQVAPPASREQASDDIGTRPFTPAQPPVSVEPTREFQPPPRPPSVDQVMPTSQITKAPESTNEAIAAGSDHVQSEAFSQVASQPPPKTRTGMVIASVVVGLVLLGGAGYAGWLLFGRGTPTPPPARPVAVEQPATPPSVPEKPPAPAVPLGMVPIAAGIYTIGRDGADPLEQPEHKVDLPAFFIDRAEVTNGAYKAFIDATGHKSPSNWAGTSFPDGRADFPVTGVSWQDAADYAAWAGKRLPTEAEWEAAARGTEGRIYPWGNGFRSGVANIGLKPDRPTPEQYPAGIKEVGRYPDGASPVGAVDMIGNAWEWVADEIKVYPGNTESKLELEPGVAYRVIRGGAYDGNKANDATYRGYLDGSLPYPKVGFRLAKDAK